MKVSDYIVYFFEKQQVRDFFGYQGTMIAHLVDSIYKNKNVRNHVCYNEQGAAFSAVGFAKTLKRPAIAYATSGPGAVNLLSGVADAFYDSAPVIFITGQINTNEYTGIDKIRQNAFQEIDIVSMAKPITKYCEQIKNKENVKKILEKAYYVATTGRMGPVLIDIPMNIQNEEVFPDMLESYSVKNELPVNETDKIINHIIRLLNNSEAPIFIIGNGINRGSRIHKELLSIARETKIPIITSMLGRDLLLNEDELNFGYLGGGYGHRYANIISYKKADLIISFGCSLCKRQTAMKTENFAQNAQIVRIDLDENELKRKVHSDEVSYCVDCKDVIVGIKKKIKYLKSHKRWHERCALIKNKLEKFDSQTPERLPNRYIDIISDYIDYESVICCDVGQHQIWVAQSFKIKNGQSLLFSGGHGAMGFALPAAIGAYYGTGKKVAVICGDGAMQMNIQELQAIASEKLPILIIVLNNHSLGLIQQQQDDLFNGRYYGSIEDSGYVSPDFEKIGFAYGISSYKVQGLAELERILKNLNTSVPTLLEVEMDIQSRAYPKTYFGEEMYNQRPYMPETLMKEILSI